MQKAQYPRKQRSNEVGDYCINAPSKSPPRMSISEGLASLLVCDTLMA